MAGSSVLEQMVEAGIFLDQCLLVARSIFAKRRNRQFGRYVEVERTIEVEHGAGLFADVSRHVDVDKRTRPRVGRQLDERLAGLLGRGKGRCCGGCYTVELIELQAHEGVNTCGRSGQRHDKVGFLLASEDVGYRSEERRVGKECRSRWSPYH